MGEAMTSTAIGITVPGAITPKLLVTVTRAITPKLLSSMPAHLGVIARVTVTK